VYTLSEHDAFAAMTLFLNRFAERAGDDLLTLLGDITLRPSGGTFDPAAWDDWMDCVRLIATSPRADNSDVRHLPDDGEFATTEDVE
jgi:hypothetical protein